jgi:hypothetical protein
VKFEICVGLLATSAHKKIGLLRMQAVCMEGNLVVLLLGGDVSIAKVES